MTSSVTRWHQLRQRLLELEQSAQRKPGSTTLILVTKGQPLETVLPLIDAGQKHLGENTVQEALTKISALPHKDLVWHFLGHIQSNKARAIAQHFDWVHSVSREKEAHLLSKYHPSQKSPLNLCLQVKLDDNPKRAGASPDALPALVQTVQTLPGLRLRGLMVVLPMSPDPSSQREGFHAIQALQMQMNEQGAKLDTLSMGMTNDFESAILEGATHIRIGKGIFAPQKEKNG